MSLSAERRVSPNAGARRPAYLERQRVILYHMLTVTREQRRCLIEGDLKGLDETNRLLGSLLETQQALHGETPAGDRADSALTADPTLIEELHCLAYELRQESRTNYLLACRGAGFADLSISLLIGADRQSGSDRQSTFDRQSGADGQSSFDRESTLDQADVGARSHGAASSSRPHLMDRPA